MSFDPKLARWRLLAKRRLPRLVRRLLTLTSNVDAVELLSQLSLTHLMYPENKLASKDEYARWQVRLEFLTWLLLSRPVVKAPASPAANEVMEAVSATVAEYFKAYGFSLWQIPGTEDPKADARRTIQLESLFVRGEGLPYQIQAYATGLYRPHSAWMKQNLGFDIDDAFTISTAIVSLVERKFNGRLAEGRSAAERARTEYERLLKTEQTKLTLDETLTVDRIRTIGPENAAIAYGTFVAFSASKAVLGITQDEIVQELGGLSDRIARFLARMSQRAGELGGQPDPLDFNPLLKHPLILEDGAYYLIVPPLLYHSLMTTFHFDIFANEGYRPTYDEVKARWLEDRALDALRVLFDNQAEVHGRLKYGPTKARGELDGLIKFDNKVILVEGKWKTLTLPAKRGDVDAIIKDLQGSIRASYRQATRARDYIRSQEVAVLEDSNGRSVAIRSDDVHEFFMVSLLGRGDLAVLVAKPSLLHELGIFGATDFPWAVSLMDLEVVVHFLEFPSQIFDYLKRRDAILRSGRFVFHDEWDLLGTYLHGLLDPADKRYEGVDGIFLSGMDEEIERYLATRDAPNGQQVERPRRAISEQIRGLIHAVESLDRPGRTDFVIALLSLPNSTLQSIGELIDATVNKTLSDRKLHSFSLVAPNGDLGFCLVAVYGNLAALQRSLISLCVMKKYETRTSTWLGLGVDVSLPRPPHFVSFQTGEWHHDPEMERVLSHMKRLDPPSS